MLDSRLRQLVQEASASDGRAVDELLAEFLPSVRAFLRLRAGPLLLDKESVSDLAQSVCRDVLEGLDRFRYDGEDGFRRWLFKTAQRKIADRYEHYLAQKRSPEREAAARDVADDSTLECYRFCSPSRHAIAREELARVERAIAGLPPEQQSVVVLAKIQGLSHRAIAGELGKSEEAVRMTLHRALAKLSGALAGE